MVLGSAGKQNAKKPPCDGDFRQPRLVPKGTEFAVQLSLIIASIWAALCFMASACCGRPVAA